MGTTAKQSDHIRVEPEKRFLQEIDYKEFVRKVVEAEKKVKESDNKIVEIEKNVK